MEIHELTERQSSLDTGVYLPVDDGDVTQKIDYPRLAQAIIEQYTASSLGGSYRSIKTALDAIKTTVDGKVNTSDVVNNVVTTAAGKVLDARQGKTLNDSISTLNTNSATAQANVPDAIPSGSDLNSYTSGGTYRVASDSIASNISNMPRAASGRLIVIPQTAVYITQIYIPSTSVSFIYTRCKNSTGWVGWQPVVLGGVSLAQPTFNNNQNVYTSTGTWNVYARKEGTVCQLMFNASFTNVAAGSAATVTITTLPEGYRPAITAIQIIVAQNGSRFIQSIEPNGNVTLYNLDGQAHSSGYFIRFTVCFTL